MQCMSNIMNCKQSNVGLLIEHCNINLCNLGFGISSLNIYHVLFLCVCSMCLVLSICMQSSRVLSTQIVFCMCVRTLIICTMDMDRI